MRVRLAVLCEIRILPNRILDYLEMVIPALEDRGSHPEELKDIANDYKQVTFLY